MTSITAHRFEVGSFCVFPGAPEIQAGGDPVSEESERHGTGKI